jgi:isopenicillin-N epimerase
MGTIILPGTGAASGGIRPGGYEDPMQETLVRKHRIQVPVWSLPSTRQRLLRLSAQLYNSVEQYEYLAEALAEELTESI